MFVKITISINSDLKSLDRKSEYELCELIVLLDDFDTAAKVELLTESSGPTPSKRAKVERSASMGSRGALAAEKPPTTESNPFMANFITTTFKTTKSQGLLSHAIVAGVNRVGSGMLTESRFKFCHMLDNPYAHYFGFTEEEVKKFIKHIEAEILQKPIPDRLKEGMKRWYNGKFWF
jgi:hypothetical protein